MTITLNQPTRVCFRRLQWLRQQTLCNQLCQVSELFTYTAETHPLVLAMWDCSMLSLRRNWIRLPSPQSSVIHWGVQSIRRWRGTVSSGEIKKLGSYVIAAEKIGKATSYQEEESLWSMEVIRRTVCKAIVKWLLMPEMSDIYRDVLGWFIMWGNLLVG